MENKTKSFGQEVVQLAAVLLIICAVVAGMLGGVNAVTAPMIAENNAKSLQQALAALLPEASFADVTDEGTAVEDPNGVVLNVYDGGDAGKCVKVAPTGFGGAINMIVGIHGDGTVAGVQILSMSETPGLGAKASEAGFAGQFAGAEASGQLAVTKDGGTINAITGATITSRAVADGVNAACNFVMN